MTSEQSEKVLRSGSLSHSLKQAVCIWHEVRSVDSGHHFHRTTEYAELEGTLRKEG